MNQDEVRRISNLARISLTDEEVEKFAGELTGVFDHINKLAELDVEDIEPLAIMDEQESVVREDIPKPSYTQDLILSNAQNVDLG